MFWPAFTVRVGRGVGEAVGGVLKGTVLLTSTLLFSVAIADYDGSSGAAPRGRGACSVDNFTGKTSMD